MAADLYLDHNVAAGMESPLRALGYDVVTARAVGLDSAKDDEHLLFAAQQRRVLITYNAKDFQMLHDAWRRWSLAWQVDRPHSGVLIIPQPPVWPAERAAGELHAYFQTNPALANVLYHYRTETGWTRRLLPRPPGG